MFVTHKPWSLVAKAAKTKKRPNWSRTRSPKRLEALSRRMEKAVTIDLVKGIKTFRSKIPDPEKIYEAWMKGNYSAIDREIEWEKFPGEIAPASEKTFEAMMASADIAMQALPPPIKSRYRFDYKNPGIERIWRKRTGEWMVDPLVKGGRESIQDIVYTQFTQGLNPRDLVGEIKNYIGLYPRLARAHTNYVLSLKQTDMAPERIDELSENYYDKLLTYRANMIARTETNFMLNRGQLEVWQQGQENGIIPLGATKVWVVDGNPCEDCQEMDGEAVGLAESWVTPDGDVVEVPTEIHPHCACMMTIEYGDIETAEFEESED
jgi:hypothetical protein